jgi:hypothetical protein
VENGEDDVVEKVLVVVGVVNQELLLNGAVDVAGVVPKGVVVVVVGAFV